MSKPDLSIFEGMDDKTFHERHWQNMPEFQQADKAAQRQIIVSFDDDEQVREFAKLIGQTITKKTKSVWFKERQRNNMTDLFWTSKDD